MLVLGGIAAVFYKPVVAIFTLLGLTILLRAVYLDRRYGTNRPTKREVEAMSAAEFKKRLREPEFRRWVDQGLKFNLPIGIDSEMK